MFCRVCNFVSTRRRRVAARWCRTANENRRSRAYVSLCPYCPALSEGWQSVCHHWQKLCGGEKYQHVLTLILGKIRFVTAPDRLSLGLPCGNPCFFQTTLQHSFHVPTSVPNACLGRVAWAVSAVTFNDSHWFAFFRAPSVITGNRTEEQNRADNVKTSHSKKMRAQQGRIV